MTVPRPPPAQPRSLWPVLAVVSLFASVCLAALWWFVLRDSDDGSAIEGLDVTSTIPVDEKSAVTTTVADATREATTITPTTSTSVASDTTTTVSLPLVIADTFESRTPPTPPPHVERPSITTTTTAPAPPPLPPVASTTVPGDLALSSGWMSRPACDGSYVTLVGSATTPATYAQNVSDLLRTYPGTQYLRTDQTCSSLRPLDEHGNAIYSVYYGPFTLTEACDALAHGPEGAYVRVLRNDVPPATDFECP